jgi:ribosomal subunit interface protein
MKLEGILGKNIDLTPAIEKRVRTRVQKLSKIVKRMEPASIRAEVGKPSAHHRKGEDVFYAELNASIQGKDFHSSKTEPDLYKAIEKVRDDMYQQIISWKKKERQAKRKGGAMIKRLLRFNSDEE